MDSDGRDPFVSMMTAESKVNLNLSDFAPQSMLRVAEHSIARPKFPAIDFHNHIDGLEPAEVLRIMDACGIERLVNITMKPGTEGLESLARLHAASPNRFSTIAWMDWRDLVEDGFVKRSVQRLERCVAAGAIGMKIWKDLGLRLRDRDGSILRIDDSRLDPLFARAAELGVFIMFHTADPAAFFLSTDACNERYEELSAHPDWSFYGSAFSREELLAATKPRLCAPSRDPVRRRPYGRAAGGSCRACDNARGSPKRSTRYVSTSGGTGPSAVHCSALLPAISRSHPLWRRPAARRVDVSRTLSVL